MEKLAILGGMPVVKDPLPPYPSIGKEEKEAVIRVVESGSLSGFYGSWGDQFMGGPVVREFEQAWRLQFGTKHAVSVNSATSGLYAAVGAAGIGPGDEVIVPPYTMSATAMAPLIYGGIPVFVDIEDRTFCLDVNAVRKAVTTRTRAIMAVNLFGHPAPLRDLRSLADATGLVLIEDNAQGPLAEEGGRYAGTIGHIGVFSLNYHKHIHTGEGGICVTDDDELALRLQAIRNHAENIVEPLGLTNLTNLVGFNYRMTEMSAAVGLVQLKNAEEHVRRRENLAQYLTTGIEGLEGLVPPRVRSGCRHVYYVWPLRFLEEAMGITREKFSRALSAEGFPHFEGYQMPLYLLPVFQRRMAFGNKGFPFSLSDVKYERGMCPVVERLWQKEFIGFETCAYLVDDQHAELLVEAVRKVHHNRKQLAES